MKERAFQQRRAGFLNGFGSRQRSCGPEGDENAVNDELRDVPNNRWHRQQALFANLALREEREDADCDWQRFLRCQQNDRNPLLGLESEQRCGGTIEDEICEMQEDGPREEDEDVSISHCTKLGRFKKKKKNQKHQKKRHAMQKASVLVLCGLPMSSECQCRGVL